MAVIAVRSNSETRPVSVSVQRRYALGHARSRVVTLGRAGVGSDTIKRLLLCHLGPTGRRRWLVAIVRQALRQMRHWVDIGNDAVPWVASTGVRLEVFGGRVMVAHG